MVENKKTTVKVNYEGETKRFRLKGADYNELVKLVGKAFGQMPQGNKFYYLDEDQEIISVSSKTDLEEAFEGNMNGILKLVLAQNSAEANNILADVIMSETNSLSRAPSGMSIADIQSVKSLRSSDFEAIRHSMIAEPAAATQAPIE